MAMIFNVFLALLLWGLEPRRKIDQMQARAVPHHNQSLAGIETSKLQKWQAIAVTTVRFFFICEIVNAPDPTRSSCRSQPAPP